MISQLVTTQHLTNKAIIYVRQSTAHQTLTNQESLQLQYALKQRAMELGWSPDNIKIIDSDLGLSGSAAEHREGFKDVLAQVAMKKLGRKRPSFKTASAAAAYPFFQIYPFR